MLCARCRARTLFSLTLSRSFHPSPALASSSSSSLSPSSSPSSPFKLRRVKSQRELIEAPHSPHSPSETRRREALSTKTPRKQSSILQSFRSRDPPSSPSRRTMSHDQESSQIDPASAMREVIGTYSMHGSEGHTPVKRMRQYFEDTSRNVEFEEDGGVALPRESESVLPFRNSRNFYAEERRAPPSAPLTGNENGNGDKGWGLDPTLLLPKMVPGPASNDPRSVSYSHEELMTMVEEQRKDREALLGKWKNKTHRQDTKHDEQKHAHRRYPLRSRNRGSGQVGMGDGNVNQSIQALGYDTSNAFHVEQSMASGPYGFGHGPASQQQMQDYSTSYSRLHPSNLPPQSPIPAHAHAYLNAQRASHSSSRSSGRVRDPTPPQTTAEYMTQANDDPENTSTRQPLLVILDLNGTLIFRKRKRGGGQFVKRPGLDKFLAYLFQNFTVMIWTSSRPETAANIVSQIFPPATRRQLVDVWARDTLGLTREQYAEKVQVYKPLNRVWKMKNIQKTYPTTTTSKSWGSCWTQQNTILIDDSALKAIAQPYNIIEIPEFTHNPLVNEKKNMATVARQLRILSHQSDVSRKLREWSDMRRQAGMSPAATVTRETIETFWEEQLAKEEAELSKVTGSELEDIDSLMSPTTSDDHGSKSPSQPESQSESPTLTRKDKLRANRQARKAARDQRLSEEDAVRVKEGRKPRTNKAQKNAARKLHLEKLEADRQKYKMDWLESERERESEKIGG